MDYGHHHQEEEEVFTHNEIHKSKLGRRLLRNHSRKSIKSSPRLAVGKSKYFIQISLFEGFINNLKIKYL